MEKVLAEARAACRSEIEAKDAWELDRHVETAMTKLHLPPGRCDGLASARVVSVVVSRCAARCSRQPDLLLLDEPTNHLDVETVRLARGAHSPSIKGSVIVITHDRFFLDQRRRLDARGLPTAARYPYKGNYSDVSDRAIQAQEDAAGGVATAQAQPSSSSVSSIGSA